ncbi:MerR family transcriptional regulator [Phytoactinopolyspora halophila]|uniref:MerR family transcriptional regulator n=1 Tax=Phytoactinopolyspora halophila TaxID=1981511 RepID=UPI001314CC4B|nr:MerR family transcriptional regulator [Phytoactinopolyspora halophila]
MRIIDDAQSTDDGEVQKIRGISDVAQETGLSTHTLRYYERIGLLRIQRDHAGHRVYFPEDLRRIAFITRLRQTDMPIREIQRYFELVDQGPASEPERLNLLLRHREAVQAQLVTLQSALEAIDTKIELYGGSGQP